MIGTVYSDFMATNPYDTYDPSQVLYGFKSNLYDEMTTTAAYCSSSVITHPSIHSNSFFTTAAVATAVTGSTNVLLSTQYGISPSLYHRQENGN